MFVAGIVLAASLLSMQAPSPVRERMDLVFWEDIRAKNDPALFEEYLRQFPTGAFVAIAKKRIVELRSVRAPVRDISKFVQTDPAYIERDTSEEALVLLNRVRSALGGISRLDAVRSFRRISNSQTAKPDGTLNKASTATTSWCEGGESLQQTTTPWNPRGLIRRDGQPKRAQETIQRTSLSHNFFSLLKTYALRESTISLLNSRTVQIIDKTGATTVIDVNLQNSLPQRYFTQFVNDNSVSPVTEEKLSAWRDVDGITLPFLIREFQGTTLIRQTDVVSWTINPSLDCGNLAK